MKKRCALFASVLILFLVVVSKKKRGVNPLLYNPDANLQLTLGCSFCIKVKTFIVLLYHKGLVYAIGLSYLFLIGVNFLSSEV